MSESAAVETHYCEWPVRSQYYTPRELFGKTTYRACARGVDGPRGYGMVLCWQHNEAFVNEVLHRIESDSLNARELERLCSALVAAWGQRSPAERDAASSANRFEFEIDQRDDLRRVVDRLVIARLAAKVPEVWAEVDADVAMSRAIEVLLQERLTENWSVSA